MSTSNFIAQSNFNLYALNENAFTTRACADCGGVMYPSAFDSAGDPTEYECIDCDSHHVDEQFSCRFDNDSCNDYLNCMQDLLDKINSNFTWFRVAVESGYYGDFQLLVRTSRNVDSGRDNWLPADELAGNFTKGDAHAACYDFGFYTYDEAFEAFGLELFKVRVALKFVAQRFGFVQIRDVARFSNGEALYKVA